MNPPDPSTTRFIGLPPTQFAAAFPFHLAVDRSLVLRQAGATLRRICPDVVPGAQLDALFRSIRPEGGMSLGWVLEHTTRFFLLEHLATQLQLRGEFVDLPEDDTILFLGSPWFTDAGEIPARGLGFEDFAIHDPVVDLLQVFQASKMALADSRKLAAKLSAQRAELRDANDRLRRQEAEARKLALIASRTDNAVVLTDAAGLTVWVNEGFTRLTGYSSDEIMGRKPGELLQGPGTDREIVRRMGERIRRGEGFREEILNYHKSGQAYWQSIEVQPIRDDAGRIINFMAIESDITVRRAAEEALREAKEAAEAANRAKSDFLAMMSHEIRTPMNAVLGMTNLLLETPLDPRQRECALTVSRSGEALIEIINDILDFSKIEAGGGFQLEEEDFSLRGLLDDVARLLRSRAEARGITLAIEPVSDLPDLLRGDSGRLRQVLVNLIGNAIKFTDHGGVTVRLRGERDATERLRLHVDVLDTGIGISPEDVERLFRPFTQADVGASRRRGGTGLGLAISKRIVELMGGAIGVESRPGKGSRFWFEIALAQGRPNAGGTALEPDRRAAEMFQPGPARRPGGRPLRILVAEDHETNRRLALFMLESLGHRADFAANGLEAVEAWERFDHDVILMDCQMPGMDGFAATQEIRRRETARRPVDPRRVRIIALTANALKGDRERCLVAGMDGYISKPFTVRQLSEALEQRPVPAASKEASVSAAVATAPATFDPARPAELCAELGDEGVEAIIVDFLRELPDRAREFGGPVTAGREVELGRLAHTLLGISRSFGLVELAAHLAGIEEAAAARRTARLDELVEGLSPVMERAGHELRRWLDERAQPRTARP